MRLGVLIPTRGVVMQSAERPAVEECWTMARLADRAGYDAVWVGDSIVAKPRLEPLTTLAYLAGITTRVRLGTAVLLPALRHPVVLAHQIANVDQISRGRVVLGLGVGWSLPSAEREWAACGADHKRRVRRLEDHVEIWRMLWSGKPVTHRRGDVELSDHTIGPLPWNAAGPPVLITAANRGEMLPAQFDRFGRLGDGIITTYVHAEECRLVRERAEEALARHGRAGTRFELCVYTTVRMENDPGTAERVTTEFLATYYGGGVHSRGTMGLGPADVVIAALERYAAAGVSDLCIRFVGDDQLAQLERFTAEVLPALRQTGRPGSSRPHLPAEGRGGVAAGGAGRRARWSVEPQRPDVRRRALPGACGGGPARGVARLSPGLGAQASGRQRRRGGGRALRPRSRAAPRRRSATGRDRRELERRPAGAARRAQARRPRARRHSDRHARRLGRRRPRRRIGRVRHRPLSRRGSAGAFPLRGRPA
ncbi:MAG: LLM class flavin-dependent oxidoreductase, partial [Actinobacteria bacterium]